MNSGIETNRRKIEAQGFLCLSNDEVESLNVWLRFTPAITLVWFTAGVWEASPRILFWLAMMTMLGAILTGHPFDVLYNHGIRYIAASPEIPPFSRQRRFAYLLAAVQILGTLTAFYAGYRTVGYAVGIASIGAGAVYVITGNCAPSLLLNKFFPQEGSEENDNENEIEEKKFESISPLWPK
jgi:hypothetical protein